MTQKQETEMKTTTCRDISANENTDRCEKLAATYRQMKLFYFNAVTSSLCVIITWNCVDMNKVGVVSVVMWPNTEVVSSNYIQGWPPDSQLGRSVYCTGGYTNPLLDSVFWQFLPPGAKTPFDRSIPGENAPPSFPWAWWHPASEVKSRWQG